MASPGYPREWEADVLLRDGHPVHLRPITPDDGALLRAFHGRLSARTVYYRFFSAKPELTDADVAYFTGVDHVSRVAFIALDRDQIIGVGRYDALGDGSAEVAFIIRDDVQGLGLGSVLLEHLAAAARERGVTRFVAEVLPENARMLATFREAGYEVAQRREEDVLALSFDIEPTDQSRSVMSAREHRAEARSMARMLQASSVAVVGAGREPGGLGHALLTHIGEGGFTGSVTAVHPAADRIGEVPCVPSLRAISPAPDLAAIVVPAVQVQGVVEDAADAGVHGLLIVSGGFGDSGPSGLALQSELVATVHRTGMRLIGPNALGLINAHPSIRLNASLVPVMPPHGHIGFFCQSGALGSAIIERFSERGLGVSTVVSAGNRADVSGNDLLQYWEEDPDTGGIALHLETIGNARKFARLVHRIARVKPVVMVRTGGSGRRLPLGHDVRATRLEQFAVDQILSDCGLVVVDTVDQLIDVLRVAVGQPLPTVPTVAIVSNSDALAVLAENALPAVGLTHAGPPRVMPRAIGAEHFADALREASTAAEVGAVMAIHVPPVEDPSGSRMREVLRAQMASSADAGVPLVAVLPRVPADPDDGDAPVFVDIEAAVEAVAAAYRVRAWRADDARRAQWSAADSDASLETGALPPVPAPGRLDGHAAARLVTAAGGTRLVIDEELTGAVGCDIRLLDDPLFGAVVRVGADDPVADLLEDRQYRLAPVTVAGALDMLRALGARQVLTPGPADPDAALESLAEAVATVSRLHLRLPGVRSAVVRHALPRSALGVVCGNVTVEVADVAAEGDPTARRL